MKKYYSPRTGACLLIFLGQDPFVQDVSLIVRSKQVLKGSLVSLLGNNESDRVPCFLMHKGFYKENHLCSLSPVTQRGFLWLGLLDEGLGNGKFP